MLARVKENIHYFIPDSEREAVDQDGCDDGSNIDVYNENTSMDSHDISSDDESVDISLDVIAMSDDEDSDDYDSESEEEDFESSVLFYERKS